MEHDDTPLFDVKLVFGRVEIDAWIEWRGGTGYGMGRKRTYDAAGRLVSTTEPEESGVVVSPGVLPSSMGHYVYGKYALESLGDKRWYDPGKVLGDAPMAQDVINLAGSA